MKYIKDLPTKMYLCFLIHYFAFHVGGYLKAWFYFSSWKYANDFMSTWVSNGKSS